MIGVRKNSGVIRLLMAAALVLFVAACSSSSNNSGLERERDQALETVEELEGTVVDLTASVEDLMGQLAALQGTDAAQEKIEMLEARIAELEELEKKAEDDAAKDAATAAKALFKGLANQLDSDTGGANDFDVTAFSVSAKYGASSSDVSATVEPPQVNGDDVSGQNTKIADAEGTMLPSVGPWSGTLVSAQDKAATGKPTDTVVVYTNIEANALDAFAKRFGLADNNALLDVSAAADTTNDAGNSAYDSLVDTTAFSTDAGVVVHGTNANKFDEQITIPGRFAGAQGQYVCVESGGTTNDCTSKGTNKGVRLIGDWTFDPDAGELASQVDTDYSNFGWWWRVEEDGTYRVDAFHHGDEILADAKTLLDALTGSATYEGPARGQGRHQYSASG